MKQIKYILKTKSYYLTCLLLIVILLAITFSFSGQWIRTTETLRTFNNFSADNIAYDRLPDVKDSFANFERNITVSKKQEEGEGINAFVYQFLDNSIYTNKSIINSSNIVKGEFKILERNEIAVPQSIAKNYKLNLEDIIYVDQKPCKIKFIFKDIYQIFTVNFSKSQTIVFVGEGTIDLKNVASYCNFDPAATVHQKMYNINEIRNNLFIQSIIYVIILSVLSIFSTIFISFFRRKEEIKTYKNYRYAGGNNLFYNLFVIESIFIIPCIILYLIIGKLCFISSTLLILMSIASLLGWFINYIIIMIKILR